MFPPEARADENDTHRPESLGCLDARRWA